MTLTEVEAHPWAREQNEARRVGPFRLRSTCLALCLASACTGDIADPLGPSDGRPGGATGSDGDPSSADDAPASGPLASSRLVRLNHRQWENTVRDLLRLPETTGLSSAFVAEPLRSTFDTNGSILTVSQDLSRDYEAAAEKLAELVATDPARIEAIAAWNDDGEARARDFVRDFGRRAFRRPLTQAETEHALTLFAKGPELVGRGDAFADGLELVLSYFLQAPSFLYRVEQSSALVAGKIPLDSFEIATRLAYGLTNSMPDDTLLESAGRDALRTRDGLLGEVARLLDSAPAHETVADFHAQLLRMHEYETISRDGEQFPEFAEPVGFALAEEALHFVEDVVFAQGLGLTELLTAPYTFANGQVARMYGREAPAGEDTFGRLELDPGQRAGILTQPGFLAAYGEGETPNTILRGVHIARRLLCMPLPPPPNMVPALPPIEPGGTNRERVQKLTGDAACRGCHEAIINPLGFALENLDGVGRFRETENGRAVDARSQYTLDGKTVSFEGPVELARAMADSDQAHACYARHWVEYLYGRDVDLRSSDAQLVTLAGRLSRDTDSARELIVQLVTSDAFLTRAPQP